MSSEPGEAPGASKPPEEPAPLEIPGQAPQAPAGGVARRLVRLLPPPRDEALLEIARGIRNLVRGRAPAPSVDARRAAVAEEQWHLERARLALSRGDPVSALAEATTAEQLRPGSRGATSMREAAGRSAPIRGRRGDRALAREDVVSAVEGLRRLGHERPIVLLYHQPSPDNPFQALLYRRAWGHGVAPMPLWELANLDAVRDIVPAGARAVLHLHWVNRVLLGAADEVEASARAGAFAGRLDRALADGVRIVWTAHNVLPHDTRFEAADTEIRRAIVERASLVHVLAASTPELAAPRYRIPPEKVVHVPLPSFRGAYADVVDRGTARYLLGLPADAWLLALVGGLRPHKGLDRLLEALDLAAEREPRLHLVVAGSPARSAAIDEFLARAAVNPRVTLHARQIPADDMQLFLRAADVAMLPYLVTLNSAVLMMALAFGLPVVAPPIGGIAETIEPGMAVTFEPGNPASLADAILATRRLAPDEVRAAARRISEAHDPDVLSNRLMEAIVGAVVDDHGATS